MTGAGAPGAAGIIKCLLMDERIRLTIADADENAVGKHLHSRFFTIPKAGEPNYTGEVLALCQREKIDLVLPLVTRELIPLSRHQELFRKAGIKVLVSAYQAIQTANDKGACYQFLQDRGLPVPQFYIANTTEEFIHAAFELGHPQKPFCFKPAVANGSRGFRIVSDSINEAEQLFQQKPYNTYITYTHAVKILSSQPFPPLVVTEYLPGDEYSVDCVAKDGEALLVVPRLRQKMINGISVQGRFEKDAAIIDYCKEIINAIGLHGNIGIQVKQNAEGKPLLLEINPRVQGTIVAALGAGVNLPLLAVKNEMDFPLTEEMMEVKWGMAFSRYWTEVFY
jgi:carbamoyl-phosphate synthase large subunit